MGVEQPVLEVAIDIKPGSDPNCFNNDGNGVIPVAILGSVDFDVATINLDQITIPEEQRLALDGMAVAVRGKNKIMCHYEDTNGDGYTDLVCQIEDDDGVYQEGTGTGTITGTLLNGTPIQGTDSICITQ